MRAGTVAIQDAERFQKMSRWLRRWQMADG